jgi:uncharacterized protein (DUF433 family)
MKNPIVQELRGLRACARAVYWAAGKNPKSFSDLWRQCDDADWLIWGIVMAGVPLARVRRILKKVNVERYHTYPLQHLHRLQKAFPVAGRRIIANNLSDLLVRGMTDDEWAQNTAKIIKEQISYKEVIHYYRKTKKEERKNDERK